MTTGRGHGGDRVGGQDGFTAPEEVLQALHENAGLGILVADADRRILDCNEFLLSWLGYSREELLGRSIAEISHPEDEVRNLRLAGEARERRAASFGMEKRYLHKDGGMVWGLLMVSRVPGEAGAPAALVGVIQDINDRKRVEEALRRSEEKLRSIFLAAPTGIGLVVDRVLREANDRLCAMVGYRRDELVGQSARILYPSQDDFAYVGEEKYRQIHQFGSGTVETRWQRKDGSVIQVLLSSTPIDTADLGQGVTFTALDITERKAAEEAVRESEERYRLLFELESDAIFIIDNESGSILAANRAASEMYGYGSDELLTLRNHDLSAEPEETRRISQAKQTDTQVVRVPLRWHRRRDGTSFPVEITGRFFEWKGRPVHIAAIRDVSERLRAQKEQQRLEAQMRHVQKLESLGVLAGGIAHDFNNLLMAVLGNADLALLQLPAEHPARDNVRRIEAASQRAAELCGQMLAYSGKGHFVLKRVNLSSLVHDMGEMLRVSISKKAAVNYQLDPALPPVEADPSQLRQVVMNLITNASEALGDEPGAITVVTGRQECSAEVFRASYLGEERPPGCYVFLEVSDSGHGMDAKTRERVFDPFFSTKFAGRGLGLAAVLGIVRGHQGAMAVESEPGRGTTFRVFLPAASQTSESAEEEEEEAVPGPSPGDGLVLLADDEEAVREVCEQMLAALGYRVLLAQDGREALARFREHFGQITCVVLDLTMPRMDGVETLRALRALSADVPVILSSGYSEPDVAERFAGQEVAGFIQKPYTLARLRQALEPFGAKHPQGTNPERS